MRHSEPENLPFETEKKSCCGLKTAAWLLGAAIGGAAAANAYIALKTPEPDDLLGGVFNRYPARQGDIADTVAGDGPPLLLLHGLGAGSSMAEWEGNFQELAEHFTVYALDFLGWGASDKPESHYGLETYAEQVEYFAEDVIGGPCAVAASNQSAAFALRAAARRPDLFTNFVLVCPTLQDADPAIHEAKSKIVLNLMSLPILGQTLYNCIASRRSSEEFARRHLFFDKSRVDDAFLTHHAIAAHQPGARHALTAFLAGENDTDPLEDWAKINVPALLVWGRNALITPVDMAPEWLALQPTAHLEVIDDAMLLPHAEHPAKFNALVVDWLKKNA